jgi:hypothetical protein
MRKRMLIAATGVAVFGGLFRELGMAAPPQRADDPFVCPVLTVPQAAQVSGRFDDIGNGESTFAPGSAGSAETFQRQRAEPGHQC